MIIVLEKSGCVINTEFSAFLGAKTDIAHIGCNEDTHYTVMFQSFNMTPAHPFEVPLVKADLDQLVDELIK